MFHWYGGGMSGWGYLLMILNMIFFWALVVAGLVALFRYLGRSAGRTTGPGRQTPEQVLAERFARGEIDEDDYRQRLETLRSQPGTSIGS
jgi:putative membrane protein